MHYTVLAYLPTHIGGKLTNIPVGPLCITTRTEQVIAVVQNAQIENAQNSVKLLIFKSQIGKSYPVSDLLLDSPLLVCAVKYVNKEWVVYYKNRSFRTASRKLAGLGTEVTGKLGRNMFFVD